MTCRRERIPRAGFTLVELIVATGLASILMILLFRLVDLTLDLWSKGETRRVVVQQASATAELLATDLRALHSGSRGDLLAEWVPIDANADGRVDRFWPRIRLVRAASASDLVRIAAEGIDPEIVRKAAEEGVEPASLIPEEERRAVPVESGLIQVAWAVLPADASVDGRAEGLLMRGEELLAPGERAEFFDPGFFSAKGQGRAGALREVTGGILWMGMQFATQTTVVWEGWRNGEELRDAATSWDAWNLDRPDTDAHVWNEPGAGMPTVDDVPLLPRRVRLELEFETARDRAKRTRLARGIDKGDRRLEVESRDALPSGQCEHVLVGGEWMEVTGIVGDALSVRRGARGTQVAIHEAGELVHWGQPLVIEVPIVTHSDDWNLGRSR